jgi:hypothetical protein
MGQLRPSLNVLEEERSPIPTVSTLQLKLGKKNKPLNDLFLISFAICRAEIVRWVSENKRPFKTVTDRGFLSLMKTGRPAYHIPSAETVSRDVRNVFVSVRKRIAKMLQVSKLYLYSSL